MRFVNGLKSRFGPRVLLDVHPIRDRRRNERGHCSVCGAETVFVFNSWVTPDDQRSTWADPGEWLAHTRRESMFCRECCSNLRVRGFADALLAIYGDGARSVAELTANDDFRRLDVAEINAIGSVGSLHSFLARLPRLSYSEYRGPDRLGETIDGARNEDVCRLTYADESFDLVLSSDTLEHVPDFRQALREIRRVLRPGGRHIFTVPVVPASTTTVVRATVEEGGRIAHMLPPLYHGRGAGLYRFLPVGSDLLVFADFGRDLVDDIREAGFEPEVLNRDGETGGSGARWVFSCRVPA